MNPLEKALRALDDFFERENILYMVIGAIAGLVWGVQRATFDVDITVWASGREDELIGRLAAKFKSRVAQPQQFVRETSVLPLLIDDTKADVVFGSLPYEMRAIQRAPRVSLGGVAIRVCAPEDLIAHKIISERQKDIDDVRELIKIRGRELDRRYLDPIVQGLATELARPAIWQNYIACFPGP